MKKKIFGSRGARNRTLGVITAVGIILILVLNLLLTHVGREKTLFVDTSYEGLYTLTDLMKKECAFIDELGDEGYPVKVTFCADPDTLINSQLTRVVYFMALEMENYYDNFEVETVNVTYNPTAVSKYKPTSLSEILPTDIIVSYGERYRVVSTNTFWTVSNNVVGSYCGEYKMASLIMSVTSVNNPTAYFLTDHGETYYDVADPARPGNVDAAYLYDLLTERGLKVKTLEISKVDEIPSDCVLLIINNPTKDFDGAEDSLADFGYVTDTEKLDKYLIEDHGAIMVAKDYAISLPVFEDFLYEWGFGLGDNLVKDEVSHIVDEGNTNTTLVAEYDTDEKSYGYAIYGSLASLSSSPSMVFGNTGYIKCTYGDYLVTNEPGTYSITRNYAPFFYSSPDAVAYSKNEAGEYVNPYASGRLDLAGVTTRLELNTETGDYKYSYLFCANSADFFSNEYLGNASFANYEVMSALTDNMIRSDEYADMELGSTSANAHNRGGKVLLDTTMSSTDVYEEEYFLHEGLTTNAITVYTVIIMAIPLAIGVLGIIVKIKRKFL